MNSNNVEKLLDKYYSTFLERNDMAQIVITPQYVEDNREKMENMVRIFTLYPDYLIDVITPTDSYFKLYFYQRLFLRVCMRYREVSGTFPRAYSKSFLDFLAMNIRGIMQPRSKGFTCADTKKQAAQIVEEKTNEIYRMFPFLVNELNISDADKMKKKYGNMGSDYAELKFRNDSQIDIVNTGNAGRGGRRHWGTLEEFAMMDGDAVNEVVIPLMNVDRRTVAGLLNPTEPHAAQTMITTAGYKGTYAHDRTLECLVDMAIEPDKAFCFGGDYRIPVMHGLLSIDKVKDKLQASSYKLESFLREYMSVWTGGSEDSYYSYTQISKCRNLIRPEFKRQEGFNGFYVCGVDVARFEGDQTVAMIFKVFTEGERYKINLVNIKILNGTHFRDQAAMLKQFDLDYNFKAIVMDINGNGAGLADYMNDPVKRIKWDTSMKKVEIVEKKEKGYLLHSWMNKPVFFISERDLIEKKIDFESAGSEYSFSSSIKDELYEKIENVERITNYFSSMKMSEDKDKFYFRTLNQIDYKMKTPMSLLGVTLPMKLKEWYKNLTKIINDDAKK